MYEFVAFDKTVKEKCTNDVVDSRNAASEVVSNRNKLTFALNDADGACFCKNIIKILLALVNINENELITNITQQKMLLLLRKKIRLNIYVLYDDWE